MQKSSISFISLVVAVALLTLGVGCSNDFGQVSSHETIALGKSNCVSKNANNLKKLLDCVTVDRVRVHQAAFQSIADANSGTRAAGTPGYDESATYVAEQMETAGYVVTVQPFDFPFFEELEPARLEQIAPVPTVYPYFDVAGFATMQYSGSGDVTAIAEGVDLTLPPGGSTNTSTSGCEASDFASFIPGNIAVIQRGTCTFAEKVQNAEAAGAVGVVIFNEGQEGNTAAFLGTLGAPGASIPAVGAAFDVGTELASGGVTVRMFVNAVSEYRLTSNVLAETSEGDPNNVVMVGAHLDAVLDGPGINDNGSGSAAILETAIQMAGAKTRNRVRFAWWGAQESGLVGSTYYVNNLSQTELEEIALYLDFHMLASPNHVFFIYDGDDSDGVGAGPGPEGSAQIEALLESYYDGIGVPYKGVDLSFRSDYGPFVAAGVPSGGLFTGAEGIKTAEEQALWGGSAGEQYDPCYHLACDTFDNVNLYALDVNSDAVAFAALSFGMSTEGINGEKGKGNFKPDESATTVGALAAY